MIYKLRSNRVHRTYSGGKKIDDFTGAAAPDNHMPEDWTASLTTVLSPDGEYEGMGMTDSGATISSIIGSDSYRMLVKLLNSDERW